MYYITSIKETFYINLFIHWPLIRVTVPYSRLKLADFYTIFQTELDENHTLDSDTYPYSLCIGVLSLPGWGQKLHDAC